MSEERFHTNLQEYWFAILFSTGIYYGNSYLVENSFFGEFTNLISIAVYILIAQIINLHMIDRIKAVSSKISFNFESQILRQLVSIPSLCLIIFIFTINKNLFISIIILFGLIPDNNKIKNSEKPYFIFVILLTATYIPLQIWFSTAIINTVASDENLINNDSIRFASLIFSSFGFGLLLTKAAEKEISSFIIILIFGFFVMFFGQDKLLDYWASKQTDERKISAYIGVLGKSAIINHAGIFNEKDQFKTPEKIRAELVYAPAVVSITGKDSIYRNIASNSSYIRSFYVDSLKKNNPDRTKALSDIKKLWRGYADYLTVVAMTKNTRKDALDFISPYYYKHEDYINRSTPLTCRGVAESIRDKVKSEAPRGRSISTVLRNTRGKRLFLNALNKEGMYLSSDWKYTDERNFISEISSAACEMRDSKIKDFQREYNTSILKKKSGFSFFSDTEPYTLQEFIEIVSDIPNIRKYQDLEDYVYSEEAKAIRRTSTSTFIKSLEKEVAKHGDDWLKAAILPAVGLSASFTLMLLNTLVLIGGLLSLTKTPSTIKNSVIILLVALLLFISKPYEQGFIKAGTTLQEKVYRHSNYWFTRLNLPPNLSDQTSSYKQKMSNHHLRRANLALNNNFLTTPPSRSALFHVTMSKYYNSDAKTDKIISAILARYKNLGAESKDSELNERYKYIKKWQKVYL